MGIVLKQSIRNILTIYGAFAIGGINALFLYTFFLGDTYYGLVTFLLSTANLLMPFVAFGVQYTILKFYSGYTSKLETDKFLSVALLLPLLVALPIGFIGVLFYEGISNYLSIKNPVVKEYVSVIYLVAIATAYFEVFYAWSKVQMQSVYGNLLKELFSRIAAMVLLFSVYFKLITIEEFIWSLTGAYFIRMFLMASYALNLYRPKFSLQLPENIGEVIRYSLYVILAGAAGTILIDIDKFMIPQKEAIALTAYYSVAVYIGSVVETPGRAMAQILQPLIARALSTNKMDEVNSLYKKSSVNLLAISGLVFLLINLNITVMFELLPEKFRGGEYIVFCISLAKLYHMFLGGNGAIITNSKHYKVLLPYGIAMAFSVIVLNYYLIDLMSIEGAALSTLLVVFVFNTIKLLFVKAKFNLYPFTSKTGLLFIVLIVFYGMFFFWNFQFHPLLNIALKGILISVLYLFFIYKLNISKDINAVLNKFSRR
ncbi:oligosaccharide flippase family protein [Flavicella sp.]|uniref:lipopolysaccharide biosynthesis protein n=1 Tax=Flavicella sp. TaxID=2957742 RepID=UPI003018C0A6